jgi:DNA-binding protein HU-beta
MLASIRTSLKRGQAVTLVGFGTFSVTRRKPRRGKNPRTGQPMNVVAGKSPVSGRQGAQAAVRTFCW